MGLSLSTSLSCVETVLIHRKRIFRVSSHIARFLQTLEFNFVAGAQKQVRLELLAQVLLPRNCRQSDQRKLQDFCHA